MAKKTIAQQLQPVFKTIAGSKDLTIVFFVIAILSIIIVPLPSGVMDLLLTISISISVLVILISLYIPKPTDLTTFPTLILIITLFRLSLNVATTRMILSNGHEGVEAVSDIITSFGNFVVGGNYVIGIVVFTILVLINFMVITKGSGRVAEVAARFTLDAMPGKQMAIDADLNAGLIEESEAKARRADILQEANFYGAMDGSSKFVKGDAVAGIIITIVNIIGGFLIGIFQFDMDVGESAATFTILTIGDGLVSQIPALILSTATGIMITRASKDESNFADGAISQLGSDYKTLLIVGFIMLMFALVPGLPTIPMGFMALVFLGLGYLMYKHELGELDTLFTFGKKAQEVKEKKEIAQQEELAAKQPPKKSPEEIQAEEEEVLEDILKVEMLELTLGYQLIKLADPNQGGDLLERIRSMRRKIATDFGFLMPQVRIRDNLQLPPQTYQILLKGVEIGSGDIYPDRFLAMDSGMATEKMEGIETKEPAFDLDAVWIAPERKEDAIMNGYTVVDPATVVSTHMSELVKKFAEELLTRQETQTLIDKIKTDYSVVVDDVLKKASIGLIQRVFKELLHEGIPLKDILTILETIADTTEVTQDVNVIVEQVRAKLSRVITSMYKSPEGIIRLLAFETNTERHLMEKTQDLQGIKQLLLNVEEINTLVQTVSEHATMLLQQGIAPVVLICDPMIRKPLAEIFEKFNLNIVVLSHAEIDTNAQFEVLGNVSLNV